MILTQLLLDGLVSGSIYGMLACGLSLARSSTGGLHLAYAAFYTLAPYVVLVALGRLGVPVALLLAVVIVMVVAALLAATVYRRIDCRRDPNTALVAALGIVIAAQYGITLIAGEQTRRLSSPELICYRVGGAYVTPWQIASIVLPCVCVFVLIVFLRYHRFGKALRAVDADRDLAIVYGVRGHVMSVLGFSAGAGCAALAGVLFAGTSVMIPAMGLQPLLLGITSLVIAGRSTVFWAYLCGAAIGVLQHMSVLAVPTAWQDALVFIALLIVLAWRPEGLMSPRRR